MKAVVLVGGEGTRLRPLTFDLPKPLVPICGKPFMEYQIDLMRRFGVTDIIFSLCYKWDKFEHYFGDGSKFGVGLKYVTEDSPLGTAGAIKNVEKYLDDEPFYVFNGDILSDFDLKEALAIHKDNNATCTIALTPVDNPTSFGVVEIDGSGKILRFTEKPKPEEARSNLINAGLYILNPEILQRMEAGKKYSIEREIFPALLDEGKKLYGYYYSGYWMDIGYPHKYLSANYAVLEGELSAYSHLKNDGYTAPDAVVASDAIVEKPVWIGKGVQIESGAKISAPAVIGDGCRIGKNTHISGTVLWEDTNIGSDCKLDGCIIGRSCKINNGVSIGKLSVIGSGENIKEGTVIEHEDQETGIEVSNAPAC